MSGRGEAKRAARSSEVGWLGRAGLAAKGVSYGLVAFLALRVATGTGGKATDRQGALQALAGEALGKGALVLLAAGFAAYAVWRFAEGIFDRGGEGDDAKGLGKRAGKLARGVLYVGLFALTVSLILGASGDSGNEKKEAAHLLDWPAGRWLVAAIGLAVLAAGIFNAYRAVTAKFMDDLKKGEMGQAEEGIYRVVGVVGHAARGLVFCMIGFFLLKTAWEYDAQEAIGLDGALRKVAAQHYGPVLLGFVAAALGAYGAFCLVQARYRRV